MSGAEVRLDRTSELIDRLALATAAGVVLVLLLSLLSTVTWLAELAIPWRPHLGVVLAITSVRLLPRGGLGAVLLLGIAAVAVMGLLPRYLPRAAEAGEHTLDVVTFNVHRPNLRVPEVVAWLGEADPDVVALFEVRASWVAELDALRDRWPHQHIKPREDHFGVGVISKHPLTELGTTWATPLRVGIITATVAAPGGAVRLYATHPTPPESQLGVIWRGEILASLATMIAEEAPPVVLLGDLNLTPWSPHMRRLLDRSGLEDGGRGHGLHATWPWFLGPLGIPIDHVLVSSDVAVVEHEVGPAMGSDHRPVRARLSW